ncbi:50S ribosomal protein L10 [Candidatus Phytoplasma mali]|uniref:Large ribosomal subunit protein uL10 n=1 Tax=Phytoplasma mali (strain AT) TaxID=482235 RepID=RL10_PHYMT|nr:50S ribosomal protein L10 [Candidatus Phytoplasma mali]B3QZG8.1 RecName: Full=Large ribosomal subunit protein uL10; AltName: Full=50S ribosomal protein L10 [Candidatus Phytoplasma mali AT]CAP18575.1 50S ribosomal protein L10 [Candidatus Phytoplasma mali]
MKLIIAEKIKAVEQLTDKLNQAKTVIIFEYTGIPVSFFTELRSELRKSDCEMKIYTNNIMKRAAKATNYDGLISYFKGNKALVYSSTDLISPAKIIYEFSKKNSMIKIISGVIENKVASLDEINSLASLPSKEILLTMLVSGMMTPLMQLSACLCMLSKIKK